MRLFVAIELSRDVKRRLANVQAGLGEFSRDVRWAKPEQMHLTLKFLGEVPDDRATEICEAAATVAAQSPPFEMQLSAAGCFPPRGRVRIVHLFLAEESGALLCCRDRCESAFENLGFEPEQRDFTPHLTVGRVREDRTDGRLRQAVEKLSVPPVAQPVDAICVIQSVLSSDGAQYANVSRHTLSGTSQA